MAEKTLPEITGALSSLANARQHYIQVPEDAGGFDSDTIIADLNIGIYKAMKDGLAMAVEMVAEGNVDGSPLSTEDSEAVGNFHVLRRNVLALLNPPPPEPDPNRADKRRQAKAAKKAK